MDTFIYGMPLRTFLLRVLYFIAPGLLLLFGGLSPEMSPDREIRTLTDALIHRLYPDNWLSLLACSALICLPAPVLVLGADYLSEITFARFHNVNTTPASVWRILGYLLSLGLAIYAIHRVFT